MFNSKCLIHLSFNSKATKIDFKNSASPLVPVRLLRNNKDAPTFFLNISKAIKDNQILTEESKRTGFFTSIQI